MIALVWGVRLAVACLLLLAAIPVSVKAWRERRDLRSLRRHEGAYEAKR